ncbi:hypothetical protein Tco_0897151 [Tanacetum coccineum]
MVCVIKHIPLVDIEDMHMLIVNSKVDDYAETGVESYQQKVNLTAPTITFLGIVSEPAYGIIYKNNKKEKRVTRHQETHKFCDATLKRVLEGLKSYNNDVKHSYVTPSLSKEDTATGYGVLPVNLLLLNVDQSTLYDVYANVDRRILQSQAMVLNSSKS